MEAKHRDDSSGRASLSCTAGTSRQSFDVSLHFRRGLKLFVATAAILAFATAQAGKPVASKPRTTDKQPPTVAITSPANGATVKGVVAIAASASDNVGVARVDFAVNGAIVASATTSPYAYSWNSSTVADGSVTLSAKAYDSTGNSSSASIAVSVANTATTDTQPPNVAITSPAAGAALSGTVAVSVSASDNVAVQRVDFLANGTLAGSAASAPYSFSWNSTSVTNGSVMLTARAYDTSGNSASAVVSATVSNGTSPPPPSGTPTLSVTSSNPSTGVAVGVYPADTSGLSNGTASMTRSYSANTRVWLSAPLRAGNTYFIKWQMDGVDYDKAATTSLVMDASHTFTAVYQTPSCSGIAVYPGVDSLKNAVAAAPAGSTFCLQPGVHRFTSSVIARNYDQYIGAPGAILNGSKLLTSFTRSGSYWVATGQTQQQPALASTIGGYPTCLASSPACIYPEKLFVDDQEFVQVTSLAALASGTFFFDYANAAIYLYDDPTGHKVETTTGSGGIVGYSTGTNVTVRNLVFEKFGGGDVAGSGNNALKASDVWDVENNEFRQISLAPIMSTPTSVVRNNYIHHNGEYGVTGDGTFEGNTISYNNTDGFSANYGAGGSKFNSVNGLSVRGNTVTNNTGRGLWTDYDNINVTYENNIVENNTEMGIFHEVSCAAVIRNNVISGNNTYEGPWVSLWYGGQVLLRGSSNVQIYGNSIIAAGPGANAVDLRDDGTTYTTPNCGAVQLQNIAVHDNVIQLDSQDFNGVASSTVGYNTAHNILFSNNTYYLQNLGGSYFMVNTATNTVLTKDQWQAAGQDVTGQFYQY